METFIKKQSSAQYAFGTGVKHNGGIELGEMNAKLLEKIEELTLYVIELKKEIEDLKRTIRRNNEGLLFIHKLKIYLCIKEYYSLYS
ncbi:hypothetical protein [Paraflavitalea speifideaquila]|uniref:hypothetical protein n=1 Tax=Paraflavitalea speifideaquila TaxID=3076558 RepID=UPI0028E88CAD|nr:hypothetical protein [Paraflavitalea speifideiaquila]